MPMYEMVCTKCRNREDVMSSVADRDKPRACSKCDYMLKRGVTVPNFKKGEGHWESNDYANDRTHKDLSVALNENDMHRKRSEKLYNHESKEGMY